MNPAAVLHELNKKSPGARWAFLIHEKGVEYAGAEGPFPAMGCHSSSLAAFPSSAAVKLLQGVFEKHKDHSFFLLRKRIYLNYEPGPMDLGFIDLVAKRWSRIDAADGTNASAEVRLPINEVVPLKECFFRPDHFADHGVCTISSIQNSSEALQALENLEAQILRGSVLHKHSRQIAAIFCDETGVVLGHALHAGAVNKTRHAEVELLQGLYRKGFRPTGKYRMYVSTQPCRMCAGLWAEVLGERVRVFYRDEDPGTKARGTELEKRSLITKLDY